MNDTIFRKLNQTKWRQLVGGCQETDKNILVTRRPRLNWLQNMAIKFRAAYSVSCACVVLQEPQKKMETHICVALMTIYI